MELKIYSETELKDLLSNKLGVDKEEARSCVTTVSKTLDSMASPFDAEATARKCYEKARRMGPDYKYHGMSVQDILGWSTITSARHLINRRWRRPNSPG